MVKKDDRELLWLDLLKGFAIAWIVLNHATEAVLGGPLFGNPTADWPPLDARIAQAAPMGGEGVAAWIFDALRYAGWLGDHGVQLFVIASGFGLAWSLAQRGQQTVGSWRAFFWRRAVRLFPLWWGAHVAFIGLRVVTGTGTMPTEPAFWLSALGIRFLPSTYYYGSPAWWYIGLQLQLYLVFPLLWSLRRRLGAGGMLTAACAVGFGARALGWVFLEGYIDPWMRGAIAITRVPEFAFGVALATTLHADPARTRQRLRAPGTLVAAGVLYALGVAAGFTRGGMVVHTFLTGVALMPLSYRLFTGVGARLGFVTSGLRWAGRHSYGIFLVHHPACLLVLAPGLGLIGFVTLGAVAGVATVVGTVLLERAVAWVQRWLVDTRARRGWVATLVRAGALAGGGGALLVLCVGVAEWAVRRYDPQEVMGWGERPSLVADEAVGWKLRPGQTTRLRWESYDYEVQANSLGFPGPAPASDRTLGGVRVMVLGDAFTSAEGVDTARAWPRLLQPALAQALGRPVEVLNFAITGHGPNQYAAVAETFVPSLRPDVVVVAFFANDFEDTEIPLADFRAAIGFDRPDPTAGARRFLPLHLKAWLKSRVVEAARARLKGRLTARERFYSGAAWLDADASFYGAENRAAVRRQLERVDRAAEAVGAEVVVVSIPAPLQVCAVEALPYLPAGFEVSGLDVDAPQRNLARVMDGLGWPLLDLRVPLGAAEACPYQPANLHFTEATHAAVARWVAAHWPRSAGARTRQVGGPAEGR